MCMSKMDILFGIVSVLLIGRIAYVRTQAALDPVNVPNGTLPEPAAQAPVPTEVKLTGNASNFQLQLSGASGVNLTGNLTDLVTNLAKNGSNPEWALTGTVLHAAAGDQPIEASNSSTSAPVDNAAPAPSAPVAQNSGGVNSVPSLPAAPELMNTSDLLLTGLSSNVTVAPPELLTTPSSVTVPIAVPAGTEAPPVLPQPGTSSPAVKETVANATVATPIPQNPVQRESQETLNVTAVPTVALGNVTNVSVALFNQTTTSAPVNTTAAPVPFQRPPMFPQPCVNIMPGCGFMAESPRLRFEMMGG
ncbi:mucin-17-like [Paramacrobiotus metropolitanus]|uniref:mucin-17-like n=1 Tax=Paramacrobiotus metropolitanus TaxID=2943436 RepID=UPI002445E1AB|nr:mucin-17-like [Paramacrobiotus metropolitanus]